MLAAAVVLLAIDLKAYADIMNDMPAMCQETKKRFLVYLLQDIFTLVPLLSYHAEPHHSNILHFATVAAQIYNIVRENVRNTAKKRKNYDFFDFEKKRKKTLKNVEVITYMPIVVKTTVTTLNQFCCLSHNSKAIIF